VQISLQISYPTINAKTVVSTMLKGYYTDFQLYDILSHLVRSIRT
jgi:hypothetical protein